MSEGAKERPTPVAKIDLHVHSAFSKDAIGTLDEIAVAGSAKGLDGVCLTEHDTLRHYAAIDAWNEAPSVGGFRFFHGVEVSARGGHVLAIGATEEIPVGKPVLETVERVQDGGGVAVPAHPFRRGSGIGLEELDRAARELHAVEVWNAQELGAGNRKAASWATVHRLAGTGGSDCHQVHDVGNGYTEFYDVIRSTRELLFALRAGDAWGVGSRTPVRTLVRQASRNVVRRATGRL